MSVRVGCSPPSLSQKTHTPKVILIVSQNARLNIRPFCIAYHIGTPPSSTTHTGTPPSETPPTGTPPSGTPPSGTPPSGTPPSGTPPGGSSTSDTVVSTTPITNELSDSEIYLIVGVMAGTVGTLIVISLSVWACSEKGVKTTNTRSHILYKTNLI